MRKAIINIVIGMVDMIKNEDTTVLQKLPDCLPTCSV